MFYISCPIAIEIFRNLYSTQDAEKSPKETRLTIGASPVFRFLMLPDARIGEFWKSKNGVGDFFIDLLDELGIFHKGVRCVEIVCDPIFNWNDRNLLVGL